MKTAMENQDLSKQEYDRPSGCLIRLFWMIIGNAMLAFCIIAIAQETYGFFGLVDGLYWIIVGSISRLLCLDDHRHKLLIMGGGSFFDVVHKSWNTFSRVAARFSAHST